MSLIYTVKQKGAEQMFSVMRNNEKQDWILINVEQSF